MKSKLKLFKEVLLTHYQPEDQWSCKRSPDLDSFTCRGANDPCPGVWPVWTPEARMAEFKKGIIEHCYTQNIKAP